MQSERISPAVRLILSRYGRPVSVSEGPEDAGLCETFNALTLTRGESLFLYRRVDTDAGGWRMSGSRIATGGSFTPFDPTMPEA